MSDERCHDARKTRKQLPLDSPDPRERRHIACLARFLIQHRFPCDYVRLSSRRLADAMGGHRVRTHHGEHDARVRPARRRLRAQDCLRYRARRRYGRARTVRLGADLRK